MNIAELQALRDKAIRALNLAAFTRAARIIERHGWPLADWLMLMMYAEKKTERIPEFTERCEAARVATAELAAGYGLKFVTNEETKVVTMGGLGGESDDVETTVFDLGFHHGEHIVDWKGITPSEVPTALAKDYESYAIRSEQNGEVLQPRICMRRAAWLRSAAQTMKAEGE